MPLIFNGEIRQNLTHSKCNFIVIIRMSEKCISFEFCRENIEILYVSSTNKRVMSLFIYCSLLYHRFVQLLFLRPR